MTREEKVEMIQSIIATLEIQQFEPSARVYSDSNGNSVTMVVENLTVDPEVTFDVLRAGETHPQRFSNLRIALVHLFRQTPHVQRDEHRETR